MKALQKLQSLSGSDDRVLRDAIRILARSKPLKHPLALPEQPFDALLLRKSRLFSRSRELFLKQGGSFRATVVSSARALTSPVLLTQELEYTPIEHELLWTATDPIESRSTRKLLEARALCTSLFHEQNHRILWKFLPPSSPNREAMTRYLNFAESLVIASDMALGDELTHRVARVFYLTGITYDPGTDILLEKIPKRVYRNYLHANLYATYMKLQFFDERDIRKAVTHLFAPPALPASFVERAIERALRLDDAFVQKTNPGWQKKHLSEAIQALAKPRRGVQPLDLPKNPLENHLVYLWTEKWFEHLFGN